MAEIFRTWSWPVLFGRETSYHCTSASWLYSVARVYNTRCLYLHIQKSTWSSISFSLEKSKRNCVTSWYKLLPLLLAQNYRCTLHTHTQPKSSSDQLSQNTHEYHSAPAYHKGYWTNGTTIKEIHTTALPLSATSFTSLQTKEGWGEGDRTGREGDRHMEIGLRIWTEGDRRIRWQESKKVFVFLKWKIPLTRKTFFCY